MTPVATLLSLVAVDLLAAATPGPNFFLVTHTALGRARRYGGAVVIGIAAANLVWCLAVAFGLAAVFAMSPWLYALLRVVGGSYLVYLGLSLWQAKADAPAIIGARDTIFAAVARGFLTNVSNPKSVIYFGSVFAVFVRPDTPAWVQVAAVAIVLVDTIIWYGCVAIAFGAAAVQQRYLKFRKPLNRTAGTLIALFGARLLIAED